MPDDLTSLIFSLLVRDLRVTGMCIPERRYQPAPTDPLAGLQVTVLQFPQLKISVLVEGPWLNVSVLCSIPPVPPNLSVTWGVAVAAGGAGGQAGRYVKTSPACP